MNVVKRKYENKFVQKYIYRKKNHTINRLAITDYWFDLAPFSIFTTDVN